MFSLVKYERPTFEIEVEENVVIHIYPPTQELKTRLVAVNSLKGKELENKLYDLLAEIMSSNKEKYVIESDQLRAYPEDALMAFLMAFKDFIQELYKDPN